MITCLIVDKDPEARQEIRKLVEQVEFLQLAGECESALQAIHHLQVQQVKLLLLEIELPGISGLEMLESLPHPPPAIFITTKPDYAAEAFNLGVVDYLLKPVRPARFLKALNRANQQFTDLSGPNHRDHFIFLRFDNVLQRIDLDDILHLEAMGDYVRIATTQKKLTVHMTLKAISDKLPEDRFIRIHRSHIVAVDKIDSFADNMVNIQKTALPVSESFRLPLLERLNGIL
jgi:DNA-binding LytR/AlgR family response regulator